jgi:hypothetical protein
VAIHVIDYKPDAVLIHDGYNDNLAARAKGFKNDYTNFYRPWKIETVFDNPIHLFLLRRSCFFGALSNLLVGDIQRQQIRFNGEYVINPELYKVEDMLDSDRFFEKVGAKYVFMRNLKSIRAILSEYGSKMVLVTCPYTRKASSSAQLKIQFSAFDSYNSYLREFSRSHPDVILLDLDRYSDRLEAHFTDGYHVTQEGQKIKAELIAAELIKAIETKRLVNVAAQRQVLAGD